MKLIKLATYALLFIVSFIYFFYKAIPYDSLKDRIFLAIERQLGGAYEISANKLRPYYFTGVELSGASIKGRGGEEVIKVAKLTTRASIVSLIAGRPKVSFDADLGKGSVSGAVRVTDEGWNVDLDFDDADLAVVSLLKQRFGLDITSKINGNISIDLDAKRPMRSSGNVKLKLGSVTIRGGKLNIMGVDLEIPDITLTKRGGSQLNAVIANGVLDIKELKLSDGDLIMDVQGKIFLSQRIDNLRLNINGRFSFSESLMKAFPFLTIVERQKQDDGYYPISITGRANRPLIKIGNFTVPL